MQRERQFKMGKESEGASNTYILESAEEVQVRNAKECKRRDALTFCRAEGEGEVRDSERERRRTPTP
jgi:hypothetical protein